jgi:aminopeptidase N
MKSAFERAVIPISLLAVLPMYFCASASAQLTSERKTFTRADSLRGSITPDRAWWDVTRYDLSISVFPNRKYIEGTNVIGFTAASAGKRLRVDLQPPMTVMSISDRDGNDLAFVHEGNDILVDLSSEMQQGGENTISIQFAGVPREAKNPPWDGGWIWTADAQGRPWATVACQGLGASCWFPCKDHQSDEPEEATLSITVPGDLVAIGNGRLIGSRPRGDGMRTWTWQVKNPINSYNLAPYVGRYVVMQDSLISRSGRMDLSYWVLEDDTARAREQFQQVPGILTCFEKWFGPYPFPQDGYKLVQAPFLGMEHQSNIAYGNKFRNGYLGADLSGTGHGLKWDYIIVHETAHEWFGNSITTADIADMWVHEGFADYAETIHTECLLGPEAAQEYLIGLRRNIMNDRPVIGPYGVNEEGSGDMYYKGASLIHMIRKMVGNDALFLGMMQEFCAQFRHQVVTTKQVEEFWSQRTMLDLSKFFDQYLRTTRIPRLELRIKKKHLEYRWANCVDGFTMPVLLWVDGIPGVVQPTMEWSASPNEVSKKAIVTVDPAWYINTKGPR